jgi:hypothetical protein
MPVGAQPVAFFVANAVGAILYVLAASHGGWAIPEERAAGIYATTGEPFIWARNIFPIVAVFLVINITWTIMLARRKWKGGGFWLLAAVLWLGALAVDFAHH